MQIPARGIEKHTKRQSKCTGWGDDLLTGLDTMSSSSHSLQRAATWRRPRLGMHDPHQRQARAAAVRLRDVGLGPQLTWRWVWSNRRGNASPLGASRPDDERLETLGATSLAMMRKDIGLTFAASKIQSHPSGGGGNAEFQAARRSVGVNAWIGVDVLVKYSEGS